MVFVKIVYNIIEFFVSRKHRRGKMKKFIVIAMLVLLALGQVAAFAEEAATSTPAASTTSSESGWQKTYDWIAGWSFKSGS